MGDIYQRIIREFRSRKAQLQIDSLRGTLVMKRKERVELARMVSPYGYKLDDGDKARRKSELEALDLEIIQLAATLEALEDRHPK